jgi:glycerate-2-kinase
MIQVKNKEQLIQNAQTPRLRKARTLALRCLEEAVNAVEPRTLLKAKAKMENSRLRVDSLTFDLAKFRRVFVVGGGKAGAAMAQAIEELLGTRIAAGVINVPYGTKRPTQTVQLNEARHPVPDQAGVEGTRRIMRIAQEATAGDLLICLISGGGSSLMPLPREGITLDDKQTLTSMLLKSGADITEVNTVRKHLSDFKGGWLAKKAYPATVLNLVLSDVMGDPLDSIASGPTVPDLSTFSDAQGILKKYGLWLNAPVAVRKLIMKGAEGRVEETPKAKDPVFKNVHNVVIGNNRTASQAALKCLQAEGVNTLLLADFLEGEAKDVGEAFAKFAVGVVVSDEPIPKPLGVVAGGETTVTVRGEGLGGRNQELALAAALNLRGLEECVIASFSTDGVDGPTDAAGAIVDGYTLKRAKQQGINPEEYLAANDSYRFFSKLGDLIHTDATGTNVNDISVIVAL